MILKAPGGEPVQCQVCGEALTIPHACFSARRRSPSPPASTHDTQSNHGPESTSAGDSFRYPNPMWGDTRPGVRS